MKKITLAILIFVTTFIWSNVAILAYQQLYLADAKNTVCWDQAGNSLTEVNSWKMRVTYNNTIAQDVIQSCNGLASPFKCQLNLPIPLAIQTGTLQVRLEAASVQPDNTLSSYSILLESNLNFGVATPAPAPNTGSNLRIIKLLQEAANAIQSFFPISQ